MLKIFFYAVIISLLPISVNAQDAESDKTVLYVTDQLRLSLYQRADAQSDVLLYLNSGDKLVVEEVDGAYARVTEPSGRQGWVKRGFLVPEPTASLKLEEMTDTNELLKKELEKLNNSKVVIDQYEKDMDAMQSRIESLTEQKQSAEQTVEELIRAAEAKAQAERQRPALASMKKIALNYWEYLAAAVVFILLLGFLIGKAITESSIRRKFQGIKVW